MSRIRTGVPLLFPTDDVADIFGVGHQAQTTHVEKLAPCE